MRATAGGIRPRVGWRCHASRAGRACTVRFDNSCSIRCFSSLLSRGHSSKLLRGGIAIWGRRFGALSSVALNVSEGFGSAAGNARLRFESARGSLYEALAGLRVAVAWGYLSAEECAPVLMAGDPLAARVFGLGRR